MTSDRISVEHIGAGTAVAAGRGATAISNYIEHYHERSLTASEEMARVVVNGVQNWLYRLQRAITRSGSENPYKDLQEYLLSDADTFFGRDRAVRELLNLLVSSPLTVLHSESGAGKTSLLHAGISPRLLEKEQLPVYIRPYNISPSLALKRAIVPEVASEENFVKISLHDFLSRVGEILGPERTLYVLVDQFEEFFIELEPGVRQDFISELQECIHDTTLNVRWLLSIRGEYFSNLADYIKQINPFEKQYRLHRLSATEAREAVTKPALARGLEFEAGLVDEILKDLGSDQLNPPEIQLVCSALYKSLLSSQTVITIADYESLGRAKEILGNYLDRVINEEFRPEQRATARLLLNELVDNQSGVPELKRLTLSRRRLIETFELQGLGAETVNVILNQLEESRLLRIHDMDSGPAYELAHDYLLGRIRPDQATQDRKAAQKLLDEEVSAYLRHGTLMNDDKLAIIESQHKNLILNDEAKVLIQKSKAALRRRQGFVRAGIGVVVGLVLLAALSVIVSLSALEDADNAKAQQATSEAQVALIQNSLEKTFKGTGAVPVGTRPIALAFGSDRLWVANQGDNTIQAVDPQTGQTDTPIHVGNSPTALIFDGTRLWVANQNDNTVQAIDPQTGVTSSVISVGNSPVALSLDEARLWVANREDNTVQAIGLDTGQTFAPIMVGIHPVALVFDGRRLWVANQGDNTVQSIDPQNGRAQQPISVGTEPVALAFDGKQIWVANKGDSTVQAIHPQSGQVDNPVEIDFNPVALAFDGSQMWVAHAYDVQKIYTIPDGPLPGGMIGGPPEFIPSVSGPSALLFDGSRVWIANAGNNTISSKAVLPSVPAGAPPGVQPPLP